MGRFETPKLDDQRVIIRIGNLGSVHGVIALIVMLNRFSQRPHPIFGFTRK